MPETHTAIHKLDDVIEGIPTRVMVCDTNLDIVFANKATFEGLEKLIDHIPLRTPQELVGSNISVFHKRPEHQRMMLGDPDKYLPSEAHITVGPETLSLRVVALRDAEGEYVGAMATWDLLTEQLKAEHDRDTALAEARSLSGIMSLWSGSYGIEDALSESLSTSAQAFGWTHKKLRPSLVGNQGSSAAAHRDDALGGVTVEVGTSVSELSFPVMLDGAIYGVATWEAPTPVDVSQDRLMLIGNSATLISQCLQSAFESQREAERAHDLEVKVDRVLDFVRSIADGDLTQALSFNGKQPIDRVGEALDGLVAALRGKFEELGAYARSLDSGASRLEVLAQDMSQSVSQTQVRAQHTSESSSAVAASIDTVATAAEETAATSRQISRSAEEVSDMASTGVQFAGEAQDVVGSLNEAADTIKQSVRIIADLAQQSHALAFNAHIEAARAGEHGRGFAVVANEVKDLASNTKSAANQIESQVFAIGEASTLITSRLADITTTASQINEHQRVVAASVAEQTTTTGEIARSVTEAAAGANSISQDALAVEQAATGAREGTDETRKAATEIATLSANIQGIVGHFRTVA